MMSLNTLYFWLLVALVILNLSAEVNGGTGIVMVPKIDVLEPEAVMETF